MLQWRKIVENILKEAKQVGTLYHATDLDGLKGIINTNSLTSERYNGISFSRNKNTWYANNPFTLVFDGDKLSQNHKTYPYSWNNVYPDDCYGAKDGNAETTLIPRGYKKQKFDYETYDLFGNTEYILKDINKYLIGLIVNTALIDNQNIEESKQIINDFKQKYNVEIKYIDSLPKQNLPKYLRNELK